MPRILVLLIAIVCPMPAVCSAEATQPNLIVILADDLGYADVGFNGCKDIPTPHIDRLATEGIRCTNGYVTHPFCSPSRAGLLTGRYQQRFGHENNPTFLPNDSDVGLPVTQITLAQALSSAGYVSSMVGKWHLGAADPFHPLNRGFTHMYGFLGGGHQYFPDRLTIDEPSEHRHQYFTKLLRDRARVEESEYLTDAFSREAAAFIDRFHDRRFFLYLSYNAPHTPLQATEKYLQRFNHIKDEKRRTYAAMVSAVDDGVGRVLATLERHRLETKTLIVFLSDNGGPYKVNGSRNTPLREGKGSIYEGGIRVPFAMRWSGTLPAGTTYDHPVSSLDIFATAIAAANATIPASHTLDGVDLRPYLTGSEQSSPHDLLFWRRGGGDSFAVRHGHFKLAEPAAGNVQLFNLQSDIGEQQDLGGQRTGLLEELQLLKREWDEQLVPPRWTNPQARRRQK